MRRQFSRDGTIEAEERLVVSEECKQCGKSLVSTRAGSFTSYFFQQNYCQCHKAKASSSNRKGTTASQVCTNCGKSVAKKRAGSFTSFLFQELRCQCVHPALPKKALLARTNTQARRLAVASKRGFTANFKANAEAGRKLPHTNFAPGTVIGGAFQIVSEIGEGGMGIVYLAQHLSLAKPYALKILSPSIVSEQSWLRFKAEAKTLSILSHPGLVKVYDLGIHENTVPYYSMDYLEGETLEDLLVSSGPPELDSTISIFQAVLDALAYAHRNNVVHRDIKPANIFICRSQEIKVLDFGISKLVGEKHKQDLTAVGEVFGSPYYMSPEQCRGEQIDFRSDIYSVGCTLFEALTGYVPFEGKSLEIAMQHEEAEVPSISDVCDTSLPASLDIVIAKCLAKLPEDRYQSAKEMAIDLTRIKEGKSLAAYAPLVAQPKASIEAAGSGVFWLAASCLSLAALAFAWFTLGRPVTKPRVPRSHYSAKLEHSTVMDANSSSPDSLPDFEHLPADLKDAEVKAYLRTAPKYFSHTMNKGNTAIRVFDFPTTFSLGTISYWLGNKNTELGATGRVQVPADGYITLRGNFVLQGHPELLSLLRSDDITKLSINGTDSTARIALANIGRLESLDCLSLHSVKLDADSFKYIANLPNLTNFGIYRSTVDPSILPKVAALPKLDFLALDQVGSVSAALKAAAHNLSLRTLSLDDSSLSKDDVGMIATMGFLTSLSVRGSSVTDSDVETLTALTNLRKLDIADCHVDEKCFASLCKFRNLEELNLLDSFEVSPSFKAKLQRALPSLKQIECSNTQW